jgi:hypothetical protein
VREASRNHLQLQENAGSVKEEAMNAVSKPRQQTRAEADSRAGLDAISKGAIVAMGGISAVIGVWAMACLVSAMIGSGGLLNLTRSWFQAVTGM